MDNWVGNKTEYVLEDGCIVMRPQQNIGGNLYTKDSFDNFVLRFEFMLTPEDQLACLETIGRHLSNDGMLVVHLDHQDVGWLAGLLRNKDTPEDTIRELTHPISGGRFRTRHTWAFEPATQTAAVTRRWEALDADGAITERWEMAPMPLHCVFRFEMEHLLRRAGFAIEALYGDFFKRPLSGGSESMIWLARKAAPGRAG